jgi:hypothetical protein
MRKSVLSLAAVMIVSGLASQALACKGPKVIFSDDFQERDAGWFIQQGDLQSGKVAVGDGKIVLKVDAGKGYTVLNLAFGLPAESDICVTSKIVSGGDASKVTSGLVFWAKNYADNYMFQITGNGTYWVSHWSNQTWDNVTPLANAPSFRQGFGVENVLRVTIKNQTVTLFVNDERIAKFRAPAPDGLVKAGFRGGSVGTEPVSVEFREFKVTDAP